MILPGDLHEKTSSLFIRMDSDLRDRYKRYTDVRLVFAPEQQIAFQWIWPQTSGFTGRPVIKEKSFKPRTVS
jgi:hypothetical protein